MLKVALTGNIGSGKSVVARVFNVIGVPVFNADFEAKKLYARREVIDSLINLFTTRILKKGGELDTKVLASIIFNDSVALLQVNRLIHPLVLQEFNSWCETHNEAPYIIHETAILFENNLQKKFDFIINISAITDLRVERVMKRDNIVKQDVLDRIANQLPDEEKCKLSDFVIYNNEDDFIIPQVLSIHKKLLLKSVRL